MWLLAWQSRLEDFFKRSTVAESICIHYSSLSVRPDIFFRIWNFKKSSPKYGLERSRSIFLTWFFFQGPKPTHFFKTRILGADWLEDWVRTFPNYCDKVALLKAFRLLDCQASEWMYSTQNIWFWVVWTSVDNLWNFLRYLSYWNNETFKVCQPTKRHNLR